MRALSMPMMLVAACVAFGMAHGPRLLGNLGTWVENSKATPHIEQSTLQHTYVLGLDDEWLNFDLPANSKTIRVSTNATFRQPIPEEDPARIRPGWRYVLRYQILNGHAQVLYDKVYHFRSRITLFQGAQTNKVSTLSYFSDRTLVPSGTRRLQIPLGTFDQPTTLRLRLIDAERQINDVSVRVASEGIRPGYDEPHLWQRLSKARRDMLSSASVYPEELLNSAEQLRLLKYRRSFLAPTGLEGREYARRTMYVSNDFDGEEVNDDVEYAGVLVNENRRATMRLPNESGTLRIEFSPVEEQPFSGAVVSGMWFAEGSFQRAEYSWHLAGPTSQQRIQVSGGLLQLDSRDSAVARMYWQAVDSTEELEITPDPMFVRVYPLQASNPLSYAIAHVGQLPTMCRISIRQLALPHEINVRSVHCQLLGHDGGVLMTVPFELDPVLSLYDYAESGGKCVTDPERFFIEVPEDVDVIRLTTQAAGVYANVSTRVPDVAQLQELPETEAGTHAAQHWFPVRPREVVNLLKYHATEIVRIQPRPPQERHHLTEGDYTWQSFVPSGNWKGRPILIPRSMDPPNGDLAAAVTFHELRPGVDQFVARSASSQTDIPPRAFYWLPDDETGPIQIRLGDRLWGDKPFATDTGAIALDPHVLSDVGPQCCLRIEAPTSARVFIRGVSPEGCPSYLKRLAPRWDTLESTFRFERTSIAREFLVLEYFSTSEQEEEIRLKITSETGGNRSATVYRDWTSPVRHFRLTPNELPENRCVVFGSKHHSEVNRFRCVVAMGDNLGEGWYRVHLERDVARPAYVVLSRTSVGLAPHRQFSRQQMDP